MLLLHSKYSYDFLIAQRVRYLSGLLMKAFENREHEKAWGMWIALLPQMNKKNFIPFSDFIKAHDKPTYNRDIDKQEIIAKAEAIKNRFM